MDVRAQLGLAAVSVAALPPKCLRFELVEGRAGRWGVPGTDGGVAP